jgi:hypothetical protein
MNPPPASAEPVDAAVATSPMPYPAQPLSASSDAVNDGRWRSWSSKLRGGVARVQHWLRSLGPYVVIELLLPGGTIVALALWAYRQRRGALGKATASSTEIAPAQPRAPLGCMTPCPQR